MAKLKGPLFSLGASGQIAKSLVYFNWKGLNVVREHVVPANPKTSGQTTQRGYLTDAVAKIHLCQAAVDGLDETDIMAYALWGSTFPSPRTWFNQAIKNWVDQKVAGKIPRVFYAATLVPAATQITLRVFGANESGHATTFDVYWGTSKTALINTQEVTAANLDAGIAITGMTKSTKYFLQVRCKLPAAFVGNRSGIYYAKTLSA